MKILFVCTGNICRSPTAEALLRHEAGKQGVNVEADSAGTHRYHIGEPPDRRGIQVAEAHGVSMAGMTARHVSPADFKDFDYIIAMDRGHVKELEAVKPEDATARLVLFSEYLSRHNMVDVPDPYYGTLVDYEQNFLIVRDGIEGLLKEIVS